MGMIRDFVRDFWEGGWTGRLLLALMLFVVVIIPVAAKLSLAAKIQEQEKWDAFSKAHECKVVGRMNGSAQTGVGYGMAANGQFGTVITTTSIPSKTGYLCNDGVTYWR